MKAVHQWRRNNLETNMWLFSNEMAKWLINVNVAVMKCENSSLKEAQISAKERNNGGSWQRKKASAA
jgi:hypothetical protein